MVAPVAPAAAAPLLLAGAGLFSAAEVLVLGLPNENGDLLAPAAGDAVAAAAVVVGDAFSDVAGCFAPSSLPFASDEKENGFPAPPPPLPPDAGVSGFLDPNLKGAADPPPPLLVLVLPEVDVDVALLKVAKGLLAASALPSLPAFACDVEVVARWRATLSIGLTAAEFGLLALSPAALPFPAASFFSFFSFSSFSCCCCFSSSSAGGKDPNGFGYGLRSPSPGFVDVVEVEGDDDFDAVASFALLLLLLLLLLPKGELAVLVAAEPGDDDGILNRLLVFVVAAVAAVFVGDVALSLSCPWVT